MMTQKQSDLLAFIRARLQAGDVAPSFEEMRKHLGLKSKSGVHRLVNALAERGQIVRLNHRARAIALPRADAVSNKSQMNALLRVRSVVAEHQACKISAATALKRIDKICVGALT